MADRARLDQRERLEQLVERAEAAGRDDERARVAHEHDLAREEVAEAQGDVEVRVERLLVRQRDVAPTDVAPASRAPRLAASIKPPPPPVMIA